jgi:polyisoprenoid-binding protein YceI
MHLILFFYLLISADAVHAKTCTANLNPKSVKVGWTAYKFSEKKAVHGELKKVEVLAPKDRATEDLLANISFIVDPSSVDSGDKGRDETLKNFFFKFMKSPLIKGYIESATADSAIVMLNFNGVSKPVSFKLKKDGKKYQAEGEINLLDFAMQKSIEELHNACKDLHKGADGISKTWSTVGLSISAEINEVCK